jgi:hypothetical protein
MKRLLPLVTIPALALLLAQGCVSTDATSVRLKAFSQATQQVTDGTKQAFDLVEARHFEAQVQRAVVDFDAKGFSPSRVQPFLPPASREARIEVLDALAQYSAKLADLVSSTQQAGVDSASTAFATRLGELNQSLARNSTFTGVAPLPAKDVQLIGVAVDALASWLVRAKRDAGIKAAVAEMDPHITVICDALLADMHTLSDQVARDYERCLQAEDQFILHGNLDAVAKRAEIRNLALLVVESRKVASTFGAIEAGIGRLRDAHHELARSVDGDSAKLELLIQQLSAEARRLQAYQKSLASGS